MQRRVYVLPDELLARIRSAAADGEPEVQTVRRLLDDALTRVEGVEALAARLRALPYDQAFGVALMSPLVIGGERVPEGLRFKCFDGQTFIVPKPEVRRG